MIERLKKRALFVSPHRDRLESFRRRAGEGLAPWTLEVATDAHAAIARVAAHGADAVIADEAYATAQGSLLFSHMQRDFPSTACLLLGAGAASNGFAHPTISPDSDPSLITMMLERACALRAVLSNPRLQRLVGALDRLPALPRTYTTLTQALAVPEPSLVDVVEIIETDPALCAKVLQLVNSALFGLMRKTSSIKQAVSYIGFETLKGLVLTATVLNALVTAPPRAISLDRFQLYSLRVARLARRFARESSFVDEVFTAALVHDVGKLVLAMRDPDAFANIDAHRLETQKSVVETERELFGVGHGDVGAYLLGAWGLPFGVVESTAFHDRPSELAPGPCPIIAMVHAADALTDIVACQEPPSRLDTAFLERAGVIERLPTWRALVEEEVLTWDT